MCVGCVGSVGCIESIGCVGYVECVGPVGVRSVLGPVCFSCMYFCYLLNFLFVRSNNQLT